MYPTPELEKQFKEAQHNAAQTYPFQPGHLFLGYVRNKTGHAVEVGIPTKRHAITIAGARAGKGAGIIIPNLLRWPHNALVIDPKGEAAEATAEAREALGQHVGVLDPFKSANVPDRFRVSFNPLVGIDPSGLTSREDIEVIADGMVKRSDPKHAEWDNGAAALLAGLIAFVIADAPAEHRNLAGVRKVLLQPDEALYQDAQRMLAVESCGGLAKAAGVTLMSALNSEKSMEKDFLEGARRHSRWVDSMAIAPMLASTTFELSELKTSKASLYLVLPSQYLNTHAAFLRLFVRCAIHAMAVGRSGQQCLFILDEFHTLGRIEEIEKAAGLMPGYGVKLWPILQDLSQLLETYQEAAGTFFGNADLHQFFGNTDPDTLRHVSQRLGTTTTRDIPLPPAAPMMGGGGPSIISAMASQSRDSTTRGLGAAWGALSGGLDAAIQASEMADYQDKMNKYQREMARLGTPRIPPEHVAALVQLKSDLVADGSISFVYGSESIYSHLAPYFRKIEQPPPVLPSTPLGRLKVFCSIVGGLIAPLMIGLIISAKLNLVGFSIFLVIAGSYGGGWWWLYNTKKGKAFRNDMRNFFGS